MMLQHCHMESPIGTLTLVRTDGTLSGLYLPDHLRGPSPTTLGTRTDPGFDDVRAQLTEYFDGQRTCFDLPLAPAGTAFQQAVWTLLRTIPHGETRTYGQLADQLGNRLAVRAVGLANGRNPISIVIPCHRVVGSDGSLTGYAGGIWRKRQLLELEAQTSRQLHLYSKRHGLHKREIESIRTNPARSEYFMIDSPLSHGPHDLPATRSKG